MAQLLAPALIRSFQESIWHYYAQEGRSFAWRHVDDPYKVVISEVMLQQTQTHRVIQKYEQFLSEFASFGDLAQASLVDVLSLWQGLGYNRRGKYLHELAKKVAYEHGGILPTDPAIIQTFPGIGKATAASICAFAFNTPTVFIETNIRTVYLHAFFKDQSDIHDNQLIGLIEQTMDRGNPRDWYYALMDYGVMLKKAYPNPSRKSKHHTKQSTFEGSDRQIRGMIIKLLTQASTIECTELIALLEKDQKRTEKILHQLCQEGMVQIINNRASIAS